MTTRPLSGVSGRTEAGGTGGTAAGGTSGSRQRWAYPFLLILLAVAVGVSGAPTPLYGVYGSEWGLAPISLTVIFAAYAFGALAGVLVTGPICDRFGRKLSLLVACGALLLGLGIFMVADSAVALVVARGLHGLGVGGVIVASSAGMLDLKPHQGAQTGKRQGVAFNLGIAVSIFTSSVLAEHTNHPLVIPFAVLAVIMLVLVLGIIAMRETHVTGRSTAIAVARPRVPHAIAADFRFALIGVMASWSVLGVFLSLFPTIASNAVGTDSLVFAGGIVALQAFAATISQFVGTRRSARVVAIVGDFGTAVSLIACIFGVLSGNATMILGSASVLGIFFGFAFGSSLRHLNSVIPPRHRGEVMSAFYVGAYGSMAVPTIIAGWAATVWTPESIYAPFMICAALASVAAGVLGLRLHADAVR